MPFSVASAACMPYVKVVQTGETFPVRLHQHVCLSIFYSHGRNFLISAGSTASKYRHMLVTGMSGIGKTSWLLFLMWLLAKQDKTVVLQTVSGEFDVVNRSVNEDVCGMHSLSLLGASHAPGSFSW